MRKEGLQSENVQEFKHFRMTYVYFDANILSKHYIS